jgi:hypothetical protein
MSDGVREWSDWARVTEPPTIYRRRRAAAVLALVIVLAAALVALRSCGGDGDDSVTIPARPAPLRAQLPGGGRRIFPEHRVVAFYGAPQSDRLGVLGIGTPATAAAKLRRVARAYERRTRPVLPAFELIATIATAGPGDDGLHRSHQTDATIERYLLAAHRAKALLVLDIQPGRGDFLSEAKRLQRWLVEPDVGIALDPEWHVGADEVPGKTIGSVTAAEIDRVARYVSGLVAEHDLPEKLFVVHQFTHAMVQGRDRVRSRPGLALTMNIDGFGTAAAKISKYRDFVAEQPRFNDGFKLFYEEDTGLMSPGAVLGLGPPPDLVVYE